MIGDIPTRQLYFWEHQIYIKFFRLLKWIEHKINVSAFSINRFEIILAISQKVGCK